MVRITVNGAEVVRDEQGHLVTVCAEALTAIDVLRDDLAEHMKISRKEATKMITESLHMSLKIEE